MNPDSFDKSVRSRGLYYQFRSPTVSDIAANLFALIDRNKFEVPDSFIEKGLFMIADNCEGSVRESVQILERCLSGKFFTEEEIMEEFGILPYKTLSEIMYQLVTGKKEGFEAVLKMDAKEFFFASQRFVADCLVYLRVGIGDGGWKEDVYKQFAEHELALSTLASIYSDVQRSMGATFNAHDLYCKLSLLYRGTPSSSAPKAPSVPVEAPKEESKALPENIKPPIKSR
jgi:hypothetical protein